MGRLFGQLVAMERYVIGLHASERLDERGIDERGIMEWQAVAGIHDGSRLAERLNSIPNPTVEVRELLPDGTEFVAVWAHLRQSGVAKLVTVFFCRA